MTEQTQPIPAGVTLLTPEDSERVANALIEAIGAGDFDIATAVRSVLSDLVHPCSKAGWKQDWFPLVFQDMCDDIVRGVTEAADRAAERRQ